ncbi:MAG TPA: hypothetical protein VFH75_00445 [Actinomycetota bacterium]|nr:hypothetical protein [Actinomycetota bacterium]
MLDAGAAAPEMGGTGFDEGGTFVDRGMDDFGGLLVPPPEEEIGGATTGGTTTGGTTTGCSAGAGAGSTTIGGAGCAGVTGGCPIGAGFGVTVTGSVTVPVPSSGAGAWMGTVTRTVAPDPVPSDAAPGACTTGLPGTNTTARMGGLVRSGRTTSVVAPSGTMVATVFLAITSSV